MNNFNENTPKHNLHLQWNDTRKEAYLYTKLENQTVRCNLCPRNCIIRENAVGFCKVRKNIGGVLYAMSYEKATHSTVEKVETEAIFHFRPGSDILALGNFGCNLDCDYCQNWSYSQFQYTDPKNIHEYSTQQIIEMAISNNIKILSWTYNDPAVWFEFVIDTAKEARKKGLLNLFKSAFFLSEEAVKELLKVIDIFAISIKAMDENYYSKFTKGWLHPVLNNTKLVYKSGIHFEISNLVVTDLTNNNNSYDKIIDFVLNELSPFTPLHFTRFHPDYKYLKYRKTPQADVEAARKRALEHGLKFVYIGNTFKSDALNTYCPNCKTLLIQRYGLHTYPQDTINKDGICKKCGYQTGISEICHGDFPNSI